MVEVVLMVIVVVEVVLVVPAELELPDGIAQFSIGKHEPSARTQPRPVTEV